VVISYTAVNKCTVVPINDFIDVIDEGERQCACIDVVKTRGSAFENTSCSVAAPGFADWGGQGVATSKVWGASVIVI